MPYTIAVAGKGGVGKTTLTGMMIQYLADKKEGPILAVDADANSNLNEVLGVDVEMTLGDIRETSSQKRKFLMTARFRKECPSRIIPSSSLIPHW